MSMVPADSLRVGFFCKHKLVVEQLQLKLNSHAFKTNGTHLRSVQLLQGGQPTDQNRSPKRSCTAFTTAGGHFNTVGSSITDSCGTPLAQRYGTHSSFADVLIYNAALGFLIFRTKGC
ncbi:hypothetical protein [Nonlabens sp.]|uniref:hypothetical protein n=1 Tax=Nonlabens sp. TaxID=1888209 RepID=UPI001BD149C4|nr:hypothetical protein [Nonlabens sp.]